MTVYSLDTWIYLLLNGWLFLYVLASIFYQWNEQRTRARRAVAMVVTRSEKVRESISSGFTTVTIAIVLLIDIELAGVPWSRILWALFHLLAFFHLFYFSSIFQRFFMKWYGRIENFRAKY